MSDYTTRNEGIGGRGIVIGLVFIAGFFMLLAYAGGSTAPGDDASAPTTSQETPPAGLYETAPAPIE